MEISVHVIFHAYVEVVEALRGLEFQEALLNVRACGLALDAFEAAVCVRPLVVFGCTVVFWKSQESVGRVK